LDHQQGQEREERIGVVRVQGSGILTLMYEFIAEIWYVPGFLLAGSLVLTIINAIKRGSNV